MSSPLLALHVTQHALDRWRERAAALPDSGERDLLAALVDSELIVCKRNKSFYKHRLHILFVVNEAERKVITVMTGQAVDAAMMRLYKPHRVGSRIGSKKFVSKRKSAYKNTKGRR